MTLNADTKLGRYEIRSKIGEGGMGEVYLAQDIELERTVALKVLPADVSEDQQRMNRFVQEAKSASALNHPNILTIYEIGRTDATRFIVTEFIDGETLRQRMRNALLKLSEVLDVAAQIASALSAAHAAGIIHRDIKPENIMRRHDGIVKVLDFGLAKLSEKTGAGTVETEAATKALVQTEPGAVVGTVAYMSPEQVRGLAVDARTDIFSLGVVIYEMATGRAPFGGTTRSDLIVTLLERDPPPLARFTPEAPAELERLVRKSLAKDRDERYQTAKDLLIDLKRLKQKLVVDAEIERSAAPELPAEGAETRAADGRVVSTAPGAAAQTAVDGSGVASSAEYIVSEIKRHKRGALLALAALVVVTAAMAYFAYSHYAGGSRANTIRSIAVLPFANASGNPDAEYLSDGISESLINSLSQLPGVKVIARSSSFQYKGKEVDLQEVARALGVEAVLTGRVLQRGDQLIVSAELVDARDRTQMWGEQYNRRAADLQAVQAEVSRTISEKLRLRLTGAQEQRITKRATENPEAYELYLTGLFYQRKRDIENTRKSLDYFNQAVALDPNFALAFARMPASYLNLVLFSALDPKEALPKAKAAAQKALELDETLADAHAALANVRRFEWDWSGAESEYKRAIELDPNNSGAHSNYAVHLLNFGRLTEALAEIKRAEELDPLTIYLKVIETGVLFYARRYDEAIPAYQNVIKLQPDSSGAHLFLGYAYEAKGMYADAINEYQTTISLAGETTSYLIYLGHAYAVSGKRDEALAILNKLKTTKEYVSPADLAILYAGLGDKEAAFQSLERAYSAHDPQMQYLKVLPHYDPLRSDPRFTDLMRRVGLTQ